MACISCKVEKLSNEYPPYNGSTECDHPSLTCLRCFLDHIEKNGICPHPNCSIVIAKQSQTMQLFKATLSKQFKEYESAYTPLVDIGGCNQYVNVTGLTGQSVNIPFTPLMTVEDLKRKIQENMKHERAKQKLLYEGNEMHAIRQNGSYATLSDYGVKPNTTICVVICLFSIPENFDDVVFDLYWGYPVHGVDYLDASCLLFKGNSFVDAVDYDNCTSSTKAVRHSGDVMNSVQRIGHHTIKVSLKKIPSDITHLFFTLSAWTAPTIAQYPNPSLKFYDASKPRVDLCKTTFHHARNSQAVVMCSVSRNSQGHWQIFESGQISAGNAAGYAPLLATIRKLIARGV
ncbi:uncharacterized protein LOC143047085 [Mytilus galloprovincialis]|uniref:uncharacterized protein LOC143047085 n=1 Tax=Mytilus galloprovincialis TaxID=29158 RepID=UPI003F7C5A4A